MMNNETLNTLYTRRSCRAYTDRPVEAEKLEAVLKAGTFAPTAMGQQSPVIVAVRNQEVRDRLSRMNAAVMGRDNDPFYGAPVVLVVLADTRQNNWKADGSLVMGNLLNAAAAVGLGSCWINRAYEMFETEEGKALLKEWGVPDAEYLAGVGNCILGYAVPGGEKPATPRKDHYVVYVD